MRRSYTKRRAALGLLDVPRHPPTTDEKLKRLGEEATAAAQCVANLRHLGSFCLPEQRAELESKRDKHMHEAHCLAVEVGLAQPEPERYGPRAAADGGPPTVWREPQGIR